ncbi:hypothetical protein B0H15DRAFT_65772 [Mycena belliarum]|uniref:Uncharacterized protein n=1 Tax=Mycena belliarum TaxID=1033014 RepID=A0AAD6TMN2_9AGAR|nr:hypothetical protein B0H15DRAFT_65772 [Mycena belliae]
MAVVKSQDESGQTPSRVVIVYHPTTTMINEDDEFPLAIPLEARKAGMAPKIGAGRVKGKTTKKNGTGPGKTKNRKNKPGAEALGDSKTGKGFALGETRTLLAALNSAVYQRESTRVAKSRGAVEQAKQALLLARKQLEGEREKMGQIEIRRAQAAQQHDEAMTVSKKQEEELTTRLELSKLRANARPTNSQTTSFLDYALDAPGLNKFGTTG